MKKFIYGSTVCYQNICPKCDNIEFGKNKYPICQDCGHKFKEDLEDIIIVCNDNKRKKLSKKFKNKIIKDQNNCCYWCGIEFGTYYQRYQKIQIIKPHFDHIIPYSFLQSNPKENYVASCNLCNRFKSNKMFENDSEIRIYLKNKWSKDLKNNNIVILEKGHFPKKLSI